jgi:hypothetical protein
MVEPGSINCNTLGELHRASLEIAVYATPLYTQSTILSIGLRKRISNSAGLVGRK